MIDLCLVNPPHPYLVDPNAQAPLGLLYVASSARAIGRSVTLLNLSNKNYKDVANVEIPNARVFGITGTVLDRKPVETVARLIREKEPRARIVLGGPITGSRDMLDQSLFDSFVVGEGEEVVCQMFKDYPTLNRTYVAKRIKNLDALPFPARDLLEGKLGGNVFANRQGKYGDESTVISTSRGCPSACHFCASPGLWKRRIVYRSGPSVAEEIRQVIEEHGVRQFRFSDDNVTIVRRRLEALCDSLSAIEDIAWRASVRVKPSAPWVFETLKRGGCTEVSFGVESFDQNVLTALGKGIKPSDSEEAIINAHAAGLNVRLLLMVGTPGMTPQTVDIEIDHLKRLRPYYDTAAVTNFTPLPGTEVYRDPAKCGCEILDWDIDHYNLCLWGPDGERNTWRNLVRPVAMDLEQLTKDKERMVQWVIQYGGINHG